MSLPTLPDLKAHVNKADDADDGELQDMLDRAVAALEKRIGPLATDTVTETHRGISSDVLVLRRMPVGALTAVSSRVGATTTALTLSDYELDAATGIVRLASGYGFCGSYVVTYTTGYTDLPADLQLAVLELAAHLWRSSQRGGGSLRPSFPGETEDDTTMQGAGYLLPHRVSSLIEPYVLPGIA